MIADRRVDLRVEQSEHEAVLALGARWDTRRRTCFVELGDDLSPFVRWLPTGAGLQNGAVATSPTTATNGIALSAFLGRVKQAITSRMPQPEWVRAEIRKIQSPASGHLYLELEERDGRETVAAAKGMIWKQRVASIQKTFRAGTGSSLMPDIKVLIRVRADFHPVYGFDLVIEDIDPAYTVGDLVAKLNAIRATLKAEDIFAKNKRRKAPVEFVRVAVISPGTSAGLGDFRRDTDRLQHAGLCDFDYYHATFQGASAPASIWECIREAFDVHKGRPYDALVIIRGGGSITDLAWLNDEMLARWVCRCPIPIFTGIGHERDLTILDEVAHQRFDTPSKVSQHITQTIRNNAVAASRDFDQIRALTSRIVAREYDALASQRSRLEEHVGYALGKAESDASHLHQDVRQNAGHVVATATTDLAHTRTEIASATRRLTREAARDAKNVHATLVERSRTQIRQCSDEADRAVQEIARHAEGTIDSASLAVGNLHDQIARSAEHQVALAEGELRRQRDAVASAAGTLEQVVRLQLRHCVESLVGLGPAATLRRGYTIARGANNRPVASKAQALTEPTLQIQFHDGQLSVENRDYEGGQSA